MRSRWGDELSQHVVVGIVLIVRRGATVVDGNVEVTSHCSCVMMVKRLVTLRTCSQLCSARELGLCGGGWGEVELSFLDRLRSRTAIERVRVLLLRHVTRSVRSTCFYSEW